MHSSVKKIQTGVMKRSVGVKRLMRVKGGSQTEQSSRKKPSTPIFQIISLPVEASAPFSFCGQLLMFDNIIFSNKCCLKRDTLSGRLYVAPSRVNNKHAMAKHTITLKWKNIVC